MAEPFFLDKKIGQDLNQTQIATILAMGMEMGLRKFTDVPDEAIEVLKSESLEYMCSKVMDEDFWKYLTAVPDNVIMLIDD